MQTRNRYNFLCNKWLDVAEDDGAITRKFGVATNDELNSFSYRFDHLIRQDLYDGHIWFSVFTRPLQSPYTTVQRVCTVFTLLVLTMLCNAMFFRVDREENSPHVALGPVVISVEMIKIGIISTLIVFLPTYLLVILFKFAAPMKHPNDRTYDRINQEGKSLEVELIDFKKNCMKQVREVMKLIAKFVFLLF